MHEIQIENPEVKIQAKRAKIDESVLKSNVLTTDCDDGDKAKEKLLRSNAKRVIKATDKIKLRSEARRSRTSM